jgi:hypothetical protein
MCIPGAEPTGGIVVMHRISGGSVNIGGEAVLVSFPNYDGERLLDRD